jgi:hypothetical protein
LLVKTEQDHHWKEHKVVGQDRTRSQLEGTQSYWSRQQDHHWKEHKVIGQDRTRSPLEGTQSYSGDLVVLTNNFVFLPVVILLS